MRIEVVCSSREVFGADRSAVRLARMLQKLGHGSWLAVPRGRPERGLARLAADAGVEARIAAVTVASSRGLSGVTGRSAGAADLTIYNSTAVARRRGDRRPRLLVVREWLEPAWRRHRLLCRWHAGRVDGVVAVSNEVAERWAAIAGGGARAEVCPNWLADEWLSPADPTDRDGILFIGRLNAWKGHEMLASAYDRAFGSGGGPSLTFVGAEPEGSPFHGAAAALGARCAERGWRLVEVTPDQRAYLTGAALLVVPSLRPEPFGNVILEGLACGARVLAFPGGGVDDLAPRFPWAIRVVPRDEEALAAALREWADAGEPAQSQADHERSLAVLREHYSARAVAPLWERILERVVAIPQVAASSSSSFV